MLPAPTIDAGLFRLAVDQIRDYAVFLLNATGHITTWNAGARRIKGYEADEIIGRHFSVFYTREALDTGWPSHELKVAAAEGRFDDEGWRVRKDGSRFWASVIITALRDEDGKLLGFSKVTRDLTDRRMQEEALRRSEEHFRLLVDGVTDYAIFMIDREGAVTSWNLGAQRILGFGVADISHKHFSRFHIEEDIRAGKPWEQIATARRIGRSEDEGWRIRNDGSRFWARTIMNPLYDDEQRLYSFAVVMQDLSDRRHIQDLEQAARHVSEFVAVLAHELRNPLAPIRTAVQVMARTPEGDPIQEAMRLTIERQSAQLERIVDDLLDISHVTHGSMAIKRTRLDIIDVIRRSIETCLPQIERRKHVIEIVPLDNAVHVEGDMARLTQLLSNLVCNAAKYTPDEGRITITVSAGSGLAVVRVRDNGRGIDPGVIATIFNMFVQGHTSRRIGEGLGVGLALARRIAELHGGTLEAHSDGEGKGSEFVLRLPLAPAGNASQGSDKDREMSSGSTTLVPRRVLIADDNTDAADSTAMLLQSLGHDTCVVYNGTEALKMTADFRPHVLLLDLGMAGLDGYEVARRLQALKEKWRFRIVALTGWGQAADRDRSRAAGFDAHLVKPVDPRELVRIVNDAEQ